MWLRPVDAAKFFDLEKDEPNPYRARKKPHMEIWIAFKKCYIKEYNFTEDFDRNWAEKPNWQSGGL